LQCLSCRYYHPVHPGRKKDFSESKWARKIEETRRGDLHAPHYSDGIFFSPWMEMADKSFLDVLGWKLFSKTDYTDLEKTFLPRAVSYTHLRAHET